MNNQDFLIQLCSRLDNRSLEVLSHTPLWNSIRLFAQNQHFWYLRVQHLLGRELRQRRACETRLRRACETRLRTSANWKRAYYLLLDALIEKNPYTRLVLADELTVDILLEARYDPSVDSNYAIQLSCKEGYTEIVKLLLEDGRSNPAFAGNWPIQQACGYGHIEVVRLLLEDSRVDPSADSNLSLFRARAGGHTEVVKLLEQDSRVI